MKTVTSKQLLVLSNMTLGDNLSKGSNSNFFFFRMGHYVKKL